MIYDNTWNSYHTKSFKIPYLKSWCLCTIDIESVECRCIPSFFIDCYNIVLYNVKYNNSLNNYISIIVLIINLDKTLTQSSSKTQKFNLTLTSFPSKSIVCMITIYIYNLVSNIILKTKRVICTYQISQGALTL